MTQPAGAAARAPGEPRRTRRTARTIAPEWLFAWFAAIGGLVLIALIAPVAGGNEPMNLQRAAGVASGHVLIGPTALPGGIAELIDIGGARFPEGSPPPYAYSRAELRALAAMPLRADRPRVVAPNPIAVLHPIAYAVQAPAIALGEALGLSPLALFYLARLAGLAAGIGLTFAAVRIVPVHRHALAGLALLPPILFSRSTLDADQINNGLAFLLVALVAREAVSTGPISRAALAWIAITAFFVAQCKSAYLLLPLFALVIPAARFASTRARALACAAIVLPGIAASLAWMIALKLTYFGALKYRTWSGVVVPQEQLALILAHPLSFLKVLATTMVATPLIPRSIIDCLAVFGPPVMLPLAVTPLLAMLMAGVVVADPPLPDGALRLARTRVLAWSIMAVTTVLILTLLYLQWTRLAGPVVDGFNGRYLYPLIPLVLVTIPGAGKSALGLSSTQWLSLLGVVTVGATWWTSWQTYVG